ncbi:MAG: CCA tRNA nucleotidyltransferase [Chloroflexota bacterium]|nr:CCA tRNA nucleotidyltransferase [Chloroflexota bacterium]
MRGFVVPPRAEALLRAVAGHAAGIDAYVVGGTVRDALLGREVRDLDLALAGDARGWARGLADALGGHFVALDDARDVARVALDDGGVRQIDVAALQGTLNDDLRRRDFTVDALAVPLAGGAVIDPCGGLRDLGARLVRMTSPAAFDADPLRLLRAVRIAAELGFTLEPATSAAVRARARHVLDAAAERRRDELCRMLALDDAASGLWLLDAAGLMDALLPEVAAGKGVTQPKEHAYDVFEHNMRTVGAVDIILAPARPAGQSAWLWEELWDAFGWCEERLRHYFVEAPGRGQPRAVLLRLAALLHDVAKPQTRERQPDGRVRFFGHADAGARTAGEILHRFRFPARDTRWVVLLVEQHLRPVQLARPGEAPTRRALYRFFRDLGDAAEATLFLSLADAAAARGPKMTRAGWRRHVAYMNSLLVRSSEDEGIVHPPRLLTGRDIMSALGLVEGPGIGRLLAALEEAQAGGEVRDREGALAFVKEQVRGGPGTADTSR